MAPVEASVKIKPSSNSFLYGLANRHSLNKVHVDAGLSSSGSHTGQLSVFACFVFKQTGHICFSNSPASDLLPFLGCAPANLPHIP